MDHRAFRCLLIGPALVVAAALGVRTFAAAPKFYDDDPVWHEVDSRDASGVARWEPNLLYDFLFNLFVTPRKTDDRPAMNVNTVDEVPDGQCSSTARVRRR